MRWLFFREDFGTNYMLTHNDYSYMARPFWYVPAKDSIDLTTLDYSYKSDTFVPISRG